MERYINPYTDFGFKKLFGTEINKDLLISFLNALLHGEQDIKDITYMNSEQLGVSGADRKAIFDVYCENDKGEKFIVEMQKAEQQFFKDRSVFYSTFPIRDQGQTGKWNYQLKSVYTIGILDFIFDDDYSKEDFYHHEVKLIDTSTGKVFFDKLTFIYLEMPKFLKKESELVTLFDKWMFVLRNLTTLMNRPPALQERIFERVFRVAEIAQFTPVERSEYEESLKVLRDLTNVIDTAALRGYEKGMEKGMEKGIEKGMEKGIEKGIEKGMEKGREEEKHAMARNLKSLSLPTETIMQVTGLSAEEIEDIE